jgi:predicted metal-dependent hydrolase
MLKEKHQIKYGSKVIDFDIDFNERKHLEINVLPDLSVQVNAPLGEALDRVVQKVQKRASWICKQQDYFEEIVPEITPRQYISGETHRYLGKQYRLKIVESNEEAVKLKSGYFYIYTKNTNDIKRIKKLLDDWYLEHARIKFKQRLQVCYEKIRKYNADLPKIQIRKMIKRWGSFTKTGDIILNIEIIKTPLSCIDYVIMHELCHAKYYSHDKNFYKLLNDLMPDWQDRKARLEKVEL